MAGNTTTMSPLLAPELSCEVATMAEHQRRGSTTRGLTRSVVNGSARVGAIAINRLLAPRTSNPISIGVNMSEDFYDSAARERYAVLEAAKARCLADLAEHRANGDQHSAAEELQVLATLNDQQVSLQRLHQQYQAQMNPPQPPRQTPEELRVKPAEKMTWQDGLEIARNSKYGKNLDFNDPNVVAGYHEAVRRRQSGENR
jgi:hypothetical protein